MDLGLAGRTILVTGGSSGVGLSVVRTLLDEGANVVTCARRVDVLESALARLDPDADRVVGQACDVRDPQQVTALVEAARARFGALDGLVNNAGQSRMKGFSEATAADWRDELDLKFSSVLNTVTAGLPLLRKSDAPSIVNVNAILAKQPETGLITTSAARAGVLNLSKSLSVELAPDRIRVNSVCLGLIDTGQWRRRYEASGSSLHFEAWQSELAADRGVALNRLGTADEVSYAIVMLLSPRASYITGTSIDVGGGVSRYIF